MDFVGLIGTGTAAAAVQFTWNAENRLIQSQADRFTVQRGHQGRVRL